MKRSNIAERQFLATDGADGQTVFQRERSAARIGQGGGAIRLQDDSIS